MRKPTYPVVINTFGYKYDCDLVFEVEYKGKRLYTACGSINQSIAEKIGLDIKVVEYFGACVYHNIHYSAHDGYPIQINGIDVKDFLDEIAKPEEERLLWEEIYKEAGYKDIDDLFNEIDLNIIIIDI